VLDWTVPGYRTDRELRPAAADGAGHTVRAIHEASGLRVTLRFHAPAPDEVVAARRAEAHALAGVRSPHVAQLYEHVEACLDGGVGVATVRQYVAGASAQALAGRLPHEASLAMLRAGLLALAAAHAHGVTHRAYKPENLLVDAEGHARLADFATTPLTGPSDAHDASAATGPSDAHDASAATGQSDAHDASAATGQSDAQRVRDFTILCDADVRAAYSVFAAAVGSLPRKLRALAGPGATGDAAVLLAAVDSAGRTAWGSDWVARGERELAKLVATASRRRG